mmetsp:Transcript_78202/g.203842  ORF Transcript_78202/g.203842 Transcript_78202/m.203842 type:complete len:299 (+) Transcript_78202:384-1280(+)
MLLGLLCLARGLGQAAARICRLLQALQKFRVADCYQPSALSDIQQYRARVPGRWTGRHRQHPVTSLHGAALTPDGPDDREQGLVWRVGCFRWCPDDRVGQVGGPPCDHGRCLWADVRAGRGFLPVREGGVAGHVAHPCRVRVRRGREEVPRDECCRGAHRADARVVPPVSPGHPRLGALRLLHGERRRALGEPLPRRRRDGPLLVCERRGPQHSGDVHDQVPGRELHADGGKVERDRSGRLLRRRPAGDDTRQGDTGHLLRRTWRCDVRVFSAPRQGRFSSPTRDSAGDGVATDVAPL